MRPQRKRYSWRLCEWYPWSSVTQDNNIMFALRGCFGSVLLLWSFTLKDPQCSLFIFSLGIFFVTFPVQAYILVVCERWKMGDITGYCMKQYLCSHESSRIMLSVLCLNTYCVWFWCHLLNCFFFSKRQNNIFIRMFTLFPYNESPKQQWEFYRDIFL